MQEEWSGRWSPATCLKFGGNMLATAFEAGLLKDRKDPRKLVLPRPPRQALEYLLYLLREIEFEGDILDSRYLLSVVQDAEALEGAVRGLDSARLQSIGDIRNFEWSHRSLIAWAEAQPAPKEALA